MEKVLEKKFQLFSSNDNDLKWIERFQSWKNRWKKLRDSPVSYLSMQNDLRIFLMNRNHVNELKYCWQKDVLSKSIYNDNFHFFFSISFPGFHLKSRRACDSCWSSQKKKFYVPKNENSLVFAVNGWGRKKSVWWDNH